MAKRVQEFQEGKWKRILRSNWHFKVKHEIRVHLASLPLLHPHDVHVCSFNFNARVIAGTSWLTYRVPNKKSQPESSTPKSLLKFNDDPTVRVALLLVVLTMTTTGRRLKVAFTVYYKALSSAKVEEKKRRKYCVQVEITINTF